MSKSGSASPYSQQAHSLHEAPFISHYETFGVSCYFTTRNGGVSEPPFHSLNLATHVGDDSLRVKKNRELLLQRLDASDLFSSLIVPNQVHGDEIVSIDSQDDLSDIRDVAKNGCDSIICHAANTPVLLCYADCVPVILVEPGGSFAVIHAGWRGAFNRIVGKTAIRLSREAVCEPADIHALIGPHIRAEHYETSHEIAQLFIEEFSSEVVRGERHLELGKAVLLDLVQAGLRKENIFDEGYDTFSNPDLFYSFRRDGRTGRIGALAYKKS